MCFLVFEIEGSQTRAEVVGAGRCWSCATARGSGFEVGAAKRWAFVVEVCLSPVQRQIEVVSDIRLAARIWRGRGSFVAAFRYLRAVVQRR